MESFERVPSPTAATATADMMDAIISIVNNEDEVLRKALRRCGMQAARMELHASALASRAVGNTADGRQTRMLGICHR